AAPTAWDHTTPNWFNTSSAAQDIFYTGDTTLLDDTANTHIVTLIGTIQPGSVAVNNNAAAYAVGGAGTLVAGSLVKDGTAALVFSNSAANTVNGGVDIHAGSVTFANSGGNTFGIGAPVTVSDASLTFANGGTNTFGQGLIVTNSTVLVANPAANSYGPSITLDPGTLTLNQSVDATIGAVISNSVALAGGTLTKNNTNLLTLSANNGNFDGPIQVNGGTLKTSNGNALGNANGGTTIAAGATLDVNAQNLGSEPVTVGGNGATTNGAIINTGAGQNNALGSVTLTGDTTFGGTGRWDIRNSPAILS